MQSDLFSFEDSLLDEWEAIRMLDNSRVYFDGSEWIHETI